MIFLKGESSWHTAIDLTKLPFQHLPASNSLIVDIFTLRSTQLKRDLVKTKTNR